MQCLFDYSCSSWYYSLSKSLKLKLQVTQNKVIRFINNSDTRTSIKGNVLKEMNMLNVKDRVGQMALNYLHKKFTTNVQHFSKNILLKFLQNINIIPEVVHLIFMYQV